MRPRRYLRNRDAAVAQAVGQILDRFEHPMVEPLASPSLGDSAAGGAFSVSIAAADASARETSKADLVALGSDDHRPIQEAVDEIHGTDPNAGGTIWLSSGEFLIDPNQVDLGENIILRGVSRLDTVVRSSAASGTMVTLGGESEIRDLRVMGLFGAGTLIGIDMAIRSWVADVLFQGVDTAIVPSDETRITGCGLSTTSIARFVDDGLQASNRVLVAGNQVNGTINVGQGTKWLLDGELSGVEGDGCSQIAIVGIFQAPTPFSGDHIIEFANASGLHIAAVMVDGRGWGAARLVACDDFLISGTYENVWRGIDLEQCSDGLVAGTRIGGAYLGEDGIWMNDCNDVDVDGALVVHADKDADNLYDTVRLSGTTSDCTVTGVKSVVPASGNKPRFGGYVEDATCNCNRIVGNDWGDPAGYGTDAYHDMGTATLAYWPNDPVYGDNFTDCFPAGGS